MGSEMCIRDRCTFSEVANVGTALLPVNTAKAVSTKLLRPGMVVAMHAFGAGSNSGTMIFRWGETVSPIAHAD